MQGMTRKYHVIAIATRSGKKTYMTATPVTHHEGCVIMSKISSHKARRIQLEQTGSKRRLGASSCPR
jgi:hypothetical protein